MSWFTKIFPGFGPEGRIRRARQALETADYHSARIELEGLEHPEAESLRKAVAAGMVRANLEEAGGRFNAGDDEGGREHLELARQFGATAAQLAEVRQARRRDRQEVARARQVAAAAEEAEAEPEPPEGDDPLWSLPPDDPRVRYAVLLEGWPESLRERLLRLGPDFAAAVMHIEDGQPAAAWAALKPLAAADPVARYERGRAALLAGRPGDAAAELRLFGEQVGHCRIGNVHSAALLAEAYARAGQLETALATVEGALAIAPNEADFLSLRASIFEAMGRLDDAESAAKRLLERAGKSMPAWRLLARVRLGRGDRPGAAAALEAGLGACCSAPGKCGNQPLDLEATRTLARLYLEDRVAPDRCADLLGQLASATEERTWDDRYLAALVARNRGEPVGATLAQRLTDELGTNDPRRKMVEQAFASAPA